MKFKKNQVFQIIQNNLSIEPTESVLCNSGSMNEGGIVAQCPYVHQDPKTIGKKQSELKLINGMEGGRF